MNAAELAAVLTAAAGLATAIAAIIRAWRTSNQLQAHVQAETPSVARAARHDQSTWTLDE